MDDGDELTSGTSPWLRLGRPFVFLLGIALSLLGIYNYIEVAKLVIRQPALVVPEATLWTAAQLENALAQLGLPGNFYVIYSLCITLVFILTFVACGWLILLYKSREWFGLYLALLLMGWANASSAFTSMPQALPQMQTIFSYLGWFVWPGLFFILYLFPSGHIIPRWARWFAWGLGSFMVYGVIITTLKIEEPNFLFALPLIFAVLIAGSYTQVYRYRHAGALERQQIKWVVFALMLLAAFFVIFAVLQNYSGLGDPKQNGLTGAFIYQIISSTIGNLTFIGVPVSIALSMLRYRLWDVDIFIRRTLQYSLLSVLLALVYFGVVVLLQNIFVAISGQGSAVTIVVSTLIIAALFNPLRQRIQAFIDRRFYRRKYSAEQALASFTSTARDEVNIDDLRLAVLNVVEQTMQPEWATFWLAENSRLKPTKTSAD